MVRITRNEIYIKVVYYGPGLSGKTTNLEVIHKQLPDEKKGDLTSIATETDRTIFFDCLPFEAVSPDGRVLKLQLFTIPGQVYYKSTRQLILRGTDGTIFVADSQADKMEENLESLQDLYDILETYRVDIEKMPLVIQYNKRDLPNLSPLEELEKKLNTFHRPSFCASAIQRLGIMETLRRILRIIMERLKLLPNEVKEEERLHRRRRELVQRALHGTVSGTEWLEFMGLHLDPRRRGPVGELMVDLQSILQKQSDHKNKDISNSIREAIITIDPGEHQIRTQLEKSKTTLTDDKDVPAISFGSAAFNDSAIDLVSPGRVSPASSKSTASKKTKTNLDLAPAAFGESGPPASPTPTLAPAQDNIHRLQKQVELDPSNLVARKKLLNLYLKNDMQNEAAKELIATAKIHFQNGKYELAKKCLEYLLQIDPNHEEAKAYMDVLS